MVKFLLTIFALFLFLGLLGTGGAVFVFYQFGRGLPDYHQLADYKPPVMTRVHAGDGRLLAEYAIEKRVFVPIKAMPRRVVNALLSAEDKSFYTHPGVDFFGVVRAAVTNIRNIGTDRRPMGASTITQQVAKNFLLTNEVSWDRKVKEAILAFRIERAFSKNRILELYLNEIYLGAGSYGVAAAALNYFNKSLDELAIEEVAFLAALPKAPNNYNPSRHPGAALVRRNWVIGRMLKDGHITTDEAELARAKPLVVTPRSRTEFVKVDYFAEEVRRMLAERFGEETLYKGGLSVRTTADPRLQAIADRAVREGLIAYDRRHGWRGPINQIEPGDGWPERLAKVKRPKAIGPWKLAMVIGTDAKRAVIGLAEGETGVIELKQLKWARPWAKGQKRGRGVRAPSDVVKPGDVVAVELWKEKPAPSKKTKDGETEQAQVITPVVVDLNQPQRYELRQIPDLQGALVAMDPHTGRILAMAGGFDYRASQFNRVTQAWRQPGSAFKPFVYLAALDSGYTPSTLILDAPFVIDQGPGLPKWRPANYTKKFYGPSTMRLGLEKSRNLMTVRLAQTLGMDKVAEYSKRLGINDKLDSRLSMSLGAGETTLLRLTAAYAMMVNGGKRIEPTMIDRIQDRQGATIFRHDARACPKCLESFWTSQPVPEVPDTREQITDPASAYQVVSMLEGVVQRGTGRRIRSLKRPLAGKTGTTNDSLDTWFIGFSPDLAVGVFAGFDTPKPLGPNEQGASVAAPIFKSFMGAALKGEPAIPFRIPSGIRLVRVNSSTGRLAQVGERRVILEAFKPGTVPTGESEVLEGVGSSKGIIATGTGGLY